MSGRLRALDRQNDCASFRSVCRFFPAVQGFLIKQHRFQVHLAKSLAGRSRGAALPTLFRGWILLLFLYDVGVTLLLSLKSSTRPGER
jgi:hypothetical protein